MPFVLQFGGSAAGFPVYSLLYRVHLNDCVPRACTCSACSHRHIHLKTIQRNNIHNIYSTLEHLQFPSLIDIGSEVSICTLGANTDTSLTAEYWLHQLESAVLILAFLKLIQLHFGTLKSNYLLVIMSPKNLFLQGFNQSSLQKFTSCCLPETHTWIPVTFYFQIGRVCLL